MIRFLLLSLLSTSLSWGQSIGPPENLGFYGGFTWDFEIAEYQGQKIVFTAQSGGNQIYYAFLSEGQHPKHIVWKKLPATGLGKTTDIAAHSLAFHPASGTLFWMQGFTRILSAGLNDEFAQPHDDFTDLLIKGDTLISLCFTCGGYRQIRRFTINQKGGIQLYHADTIRAWDLGYEVFLDPQSQKIVLFGEDSLWMSDKPYYHEGPLGGQMRDHQHPFDTLLQDPVFKINPKGEWLLLQSQNYFSNRFGTSDSIQYPRILSRSKDKGLTWTYEFIDSEWPIPFMMPPNMEAAFNADQEIITAGSLYRYGNQDWKAIGLKNRNPGTFVYDGVSAIAPWNPSIAFHAGSYGPMVSTAFGDSLFLLNKGLDVALFTDMKYYPKSRSLVVASAQRVGILRSVGLATEQWTWVPARAEFLDKDIAIAFDEVRNRVYVAHTKLYSYDLDSRKWDCLLDPQEELSALFRAEDIHDISLNPDDPNMLACIMDGPWPIPSYTLLSQDAGKSWDSLPTPGTYYWFSRGDWKKTSSGFELRFSHSHDYNWTIGLDQVFKYQIANGEARLAYDSLIGFQSSAKVIQWKSSAQAGRRDIALGEMEPSSLDGDFQLILRNQNTWDTLHGPSIPSCYFCYDYPRSVTADERYAFVGAGHRLYSFDIRPGKEKFLGEVYTYPRMENIREMEIIDNQLYIQGEYGLYRHQLNYAEAAQQDSLSWNLYPNPSTGILKLQPPSPFSVYDLQGIRVYQSKDIRYQADLSELPSGLYLVKVPNGISRLWRKL
jgi:hypothetical protein